MSKDISTSNEARLRIKKGVDILAQAVGATLGPMGRTVIIEEPQDLPPTVTKDGVTVARHIYLEDAQENMGARMVRDVASKTVDVAGDGTTTATVLAQAIFEEGLKHLETGANPHLLKKGIDIAVAQVCKELARHAKKATTSRIVQIGSISANNDKFIGELMGQAYKEAGPDGVIAIADAIDYETGIEKVDGMKLERGWVDQAFVTDIGNDECVLDNVYILLWEKKLSALSPAIELLKQIRAKQGSLLIISEDIDGDALDVLKTNKARGMLAACAVRIPGHPLHRPGTLQDIAAMTGATAITSTLDMDINQVTLEHLGRAGRVVIDRNNTLVIEGGGATIDIERRSNELRSLISRMPSGNERDLTQKRLATLSGGVVVIRVGAFTENEALEKKYRVEDAMHAVRAAIEEGVLPGGGIALARCAASLDDLTVSSDELKGVNIIRACLSVPLRTIAKNCGVDASTILAECLKSEDFFYGYNALTQEFGDLVKQGVLDPAKVVRTALQNSASIASLLLTTEIVVSQKRELPKVTA